VFTSTISTNNIHVTILRIQMWIIEDLKKKEAVLSRPRWHSYDIIDVSGVHLIMVAMVIKTNYLVRLGSCLRLFPWIIGGRLFNCKRCHSFTAYNAIVLLHMMPLCYCIQCHCVIAYDAIVLLHMMPFNVQLTCYESVI
jgi:hypothetical protein